MRKSEPPSAVYNCRQLFAFVNGNPITLLISHVYICLQFVYKRIRNTRHGVDDVSCDNSRAERVGLILAASESPSHVPETLGDKQSLPLSTTFRFFQIRVQKLQNEFLILPRQPLNTL
jgi:hypothetical protein